MPRRPNMNNDELKIWFYNQKNITETGCWNWLGGKIKNGYGMTSVNGKRYLTHRYSLELFNNEPIDKNLEVRHMCHNPSCYNPNHLKTGTHNDNMKDMVNAGRQSKGLSLSLKLKNIERKKLLGENNLKSKISEKEVREICILKDFISPLELSEIYSISKTHIHRIQSRKFWKHVVI
jgi:hypothetical protein